MPISLEVRDWNSQSIEAVLDDSTFYLILNWNDSGQYWSMGVRNYAYQTLINNIMMVPNHPLTWQFRYEYMPKGELVAASTLGRYGNGPIPRDGFETNKFQLIYYTEQDMIDMGALETAGRTYPYAI